MKSKIKHYMKEIIFFFVLMTILANAISFYKSQDLSQKPLAIQSFKLINYQEYKIPDKKPVLIHFWATWCPTCKLEASNINFLAKHFEVVTIAVKSGGDDSVKKYINEHNYTFKVVNDKNGKLSSQFHIAGFPTTFIYGKNKKLLFSDVGYTSTLSLYLKMWWASL
ncbi:redoxin domain-containing protein [Sulfurimonas autotrophica]|uniref:Alkyl hydroperoxide reductase/ Thiol specific antioxidant/ Mal allergen n=1 Tax=Sulfurimonas autotrophica (strain ATCC BAA-671 / DSM 16294 / JCM 11897 / OK10) TaxID=563040 RepID=E0UPD0_SULAO|nr:redoxin domain-containing protein [Sulfurimonas autotrophica]ADN09660.1 alkyl hydroperoxide reductase/ Thiol specific antioxidant/ Mal allergen [Sulfurimonas autotrophica DSM 16294]